MEFCAGFHRYIFVFVLYSIHCRFVVNHVDLKSGLVQVLQPTPLGSYGDEDRNVDSNCCNMLKFSMCGHSTFLFLSIGTLKPTERQLMIELHNYYCNQQLATHRHISGNLYWRIKYDR